VLDSHQLLHSIYEPGRKLLMKPISSFRRGWNSIFNHPVPHSIANFPREWAREKMRASHRGGGSKNSLLKAIYSCPPKLFVVSSGKKAQYVLKLQAFILSTLFGVAHRNSFNIVASALCALPSSRSCLRVFPPPAKTGGNMTGARAH